MLRGKGGPESHSYGYRIPTWAGRSCLSRIPNMALLVGPRMYRFCVRCRRMSVTCASTSTYMRTYIYVSNAGNYFALGCRAAKEEARAKRAAELASKKAAEDEKARAAAEEAARKAAEREEAKKPDAPEFGPPASGSGAVAGSNQGGGSASALQRLRAKLGDHVWAMSSGVAGAPPAPADDTQLHWRQFQVGGKESL